MNALRRQATILCPSLLWITLVAGCETANEADPPSQSDPRGGGEPMVASVTAAARGVGAGGPEENAPLPGSGAVDASEPNRADPSTFAADRDAGTGVPDDEATGLSDDGTEMPGNAAMPELTDGGTEMPGDDAMTGRADGSTGDIPLGIGPEGDRRACLQPPWTLLPDEPEVTPVSCREPTEVGFELAGRADATAEQIQAFGDFFGRELIKQEAISTIGYGGPCCQGGWGVFDSCITIWLAPLCSMPVSELVEQLYEFQQADPAASQLRFKFTVNLSGWLEPRCPPGECAPVPYYGEDRAYEGDRTKIVESRSVEGPRCVDDGECVCSAGSGCDNYCLHWTVATGNSHDVLDGELEHAFCGCAADHRCAWFE